MSYPFAPITSPPLRTPLTSTFANQARSTPESSHTLVGGTTCEKTFQTSSVSLSCLSPDALSVHSLLPNGTIVTRFLPLHETVEETSSAYAYDDTSRGGNGGRDMKRSRPAIKSITTSLPSHVRYSLEVDPPIEILCIDNDTPSSGSLEARTATGVIVKSIPLLCVYTRSSAYAIKIQYEYSKGTDGAVVSSVDISGKVKEMHEPFEAFLTARGNSSDIRRIRPAPHSYIHNGNLYQTLCNRGAMAMLTADADIVLFHGYDNYDDNADANMSMEMCFSNDHITTPSTIHSEQTDMTPIVDFCFMPSSPSTTQHSVWNAMTLALSTQNGSLYALSPIVFHNTVFPRAQLQGAQEYLHKMIVQHAHSAAAEKMAEYRRAKAASQFFSNAFGSQATPISGSAGLYAKANITNNKGKSATTWPVTVQPLFIANGEDYNAVQCMDVVDPSASSSHLGGSSIVGGMTAIVLATKKSLDYVLVPSGENILPRFAYELGTDAEYFDDILAESSILLEHITFDYEGQELEHANKQDADVSLQQDGRKVVLVPDPVDKTMMHHVSKQGVLTVTTNAVSIAERSLNNIVSGKASIKPMEESKTNAWTSISMGEDPLGKKLNGIVISGDVELGHVLVAMLNDGTNESVNMTAALYLNEANNQIASGLQLSNSTHVGFPDAAMESNEALKAMEAMPALHQQIQPLLAQISKGFSNMSKIVGGSTEPRKITPGALATFLAMKQSSEEEIILPVKELDALVAARKTYLKTMRNHQTSQLEELKTMIETLRERIQSTNDRMTSVDSNMKVLSSRSAAVLTVAKDLTPSITQAETQYFKDIQRYDVNCSKWEEALKNANTQYTELCESVEGVGVRMSLTSEEKKTCDTLLQGQGEMLRQVRDKVKTLEGTITEMIVANGFDEKRKPLAAIGDSNYQT